MEKGKVLAGNRKLRAGQRDMRTGTEKDEKIRFERQGRRLLIGECPRLIVDLDTQENYIQTEGRRIPYYREIALSRDLLEGKRANVLETALCYYYDQACRVAENMKIAKEYRSRANVTVREIKR